MDNVARVTSLTAGLIEYVKEMRVFEEMERKGYKPGSVPECNIGTVQNIKGIFGYLSLVFHGKDHKLVRNFYFDTGPELSFETQKKISL
jgi:hypothetical protein